MSSGISFSGLSSGIDTDSIISSLMQVEAIPIQRLQQRQAEIQQKQNVYSQFRTKLQAISSAAGALNSATAFNATKASSSDTAVASITATNDAIAGTYNLSVSKLAQAQKVASAAQSDTTTPLNKTGKFVVNGKAVEVTATDSLKTIAQKVNSLGVGVTASIIDGGTGNAYLTFSASKTGATNKIQLADLSGDSILGSLGLLSGTTSVRESITNGARSLTYAKNTDPLSTVIGDSTAGAASFSINGVNVDIDLSTDSLQTVANKINSAGANATATVQTVDDNGTTKYRLEIVGSSGTPTFADTSGNALSALGIVQSGYNNQLVAAQDAEYKLDGVSLTSSTNSISTAIPGVTLTLLKADSTTPSTSTLTLTRDNDSVKSKITAFKDAYNDAIDFVSQYSQFDKDTYASGPLFGDQVASQLEQDITSMMFSNVPGLSGSYTNLTTLGFSLDDSGKLAIDDSILSNAIASAPNDVANLFKTSGVGSTNDIQYVSSTSKTAATSSSAYEVNITALATKGSYTGEAAQTLASTAAETLTFSGTMVGSSPYKLTLNIGNSLADTVAAINKDSKLKDIVVASIDGSGKLLLESKRYGVGGNFTVTSNLAAASDNSGLGMTSAGTAVAGTDIQGTINGEEATGNGQFLTGKTGNAKTEGLQIMYTGLTTGSVGTIALRKGMGAQTSDLMGTFLDSLNGILTSTDNALKDEFDDISDQIDDLNTRLQQKQLDLKDKFARMEQSISTLQSQGQRLSALQTPSG
ncbi:MAG: hypothetical protein BGO01_08110 [Armatimonadetes bacterium 55-13]|nr:flagellar filament capping protein FliD [Armatimonadota bacterium]OJU62437.1 MAG: hypothetical protein BGO01_08110 [Armatimonadetes bacterium 55-13]